MWCEWGSECEWGPLRLGAAVEDGVCRFWVLVRGHDKNTSARGGVRLQLRSCAMSCHCGAGSGVCGLAGRDRCLLQGIWIAAGATNCQLPGRRRLVCVAVGGAPLSADEKTVEFRKM